MQYRPVESPHIRCTMGKVAGKSGHISQQDIGLEIAPQNIMAQRTRLLPLPIFINIYIRIYLCVCIYRDVAIFNYIKLRTKVVCTYVVSHHIICQPCSSFCVCPAQERGGREGGVCREIQIHLVVTKFYKNC